MARTNPLQFIQQVRAETAKIVWPTRRETVLTTVMVMIMATLFSFLSSASSFANPFAVSGIFSMPVLRGAAVRPAAHSKKSGRCAKPRPDLRQSGRAGEHRRSPCPLQAPETADWRPIRAACRGLQWRGACPRCTRRTERARMARTNPLQFIQQVRAETAKVVWPTRRETVLTTVMVMIMATLFAIFFFAVDTLIRFGLETILRMSS
jgi:preprotein translocase subunit SecE